MAINFMLDLYENLDCIQEVTNPTAIKGISNTFTEDGVYSEKIFGPLRNYKCTCGKLFYKSNRGKRCIECGTLCDHSTLRTKTFGKICLPDKIYVIIPTFKKILEKIFGLTEIKSILTAANYEKNSQKPYYYSLERNKLFRKSDLKSEERVVKTPIHDITTLYICYKQLLSSPYKYVIENMFADPRLANYVFVNTILVIPPNSRPIAKLNDKFQVHAISAKYIEILKNVKNSFIDGIFQLNTHGFGATVYKYQDAVDDLYVALLEKGFQQKESITRENLAGKTVEQSTRNTIVPNPTIPPGAIGLHQQSIEAIFKLNIMHWLSQKMQEKDNITTMSFISDLHGHIDIHGDISLTPELMKEFLAEKGSDLRAVIERQPVLWKHNTSGVLIDQVELTCEDEFTYPQNRVMDVNSMNAPGFNWDYDGDNMSAFSVNTKQGLAAFPAVYLGNQVEFEHHTGLVASLEHESIYAAYMISRFGQKIDQAMIDSGEVVEIDNDTELNDISVSIADITELYNTPVRYRGKIYSYNHLFINIALNQNKIIYTEEEFGLLKKGNLKKLMHKLRDIVGDKDYHYALWNFNKVLLEVGTLVQYCQPTFDLDDFSIGSDEITDYKTTLVMEPYIGFHQNDILFNDYVKPEVLKDDKNILGRVFESDARIKSVQLLKAASNNGIPTNIYGKAFNLNIKNSLLDGLSREEFFIAGDSARLALDQRQTAIPKGGELQRKFYYNLGFLYLSDEDDCGTEVGFTFDIESKEHLKSLYGRYLMDGSEIDINDLSLVGTTITIRSPMTCKSKHYQICSKCFGKKKPQSKALGASIGSYISESIIQTVLRAHHFSGAFITNISKEMLVLIKSLQFSSPNIIKGEESKIRELETYMLTNYYETGDITFDKLNDGSFAINIHKLPFNDDSVKLLGNIIGMIDKNRSLDQGNLIYPGEMYSFLLDNIVIPNGILSIYIELIISTLYYDDQDNMIRYTDVDPSYQVSLKSVCEKLDPSLAIFHNFSNTAITRVYQHHEKKIPLKDHMFYSMIDIFH